MEWNGTGWSQEWNKIQRNARNTANSKTKIMVIPTNEEMEIANQVYDLLIS
jgi:acetate kinase